VYLLIKFPIFGTGKKLYRRQFHKNSHQKVLIWIIQDDSGFCHKNIKGLKTRGVDPVTYLLAVTICQFQQTMKMLKIPKLVLLAEWHILSSAVGIKNHYQLLLQNKYNRMNLVYNFQKFFRIFSLETPSDTRIDVISCKVQSTLMLLLA
jgi:hypothetical protein